MHLEQVTMFGVRGERWRIGKGSPITKVPGRAGTGETPNAERPTPDAERVERETPNVERPTSNAQSGEASWCGLAAVLMIAAAVLVAAMWIGSLHPRVTVEWIAEYPDPVCERCGKVLDGTGAECAEEGKDQ